jgi:hypothetical protein
MLYLVDIYHNADTTDGLTQDIMISLPAGSEIEIPAEAEIDIEASDENFTFLRIGLEHIEWVQFDRLDKNTVRIELSTGKIFEIPAIDIHLYSGEFIERDAVNQLDFKYSRIIQIKDKRITIQKHLTLAMTADDPANQIPVDDED